MTCGRSPAPKPAGLSFGSPSFSILVLKTNELEKCLIVACCTEACIHMHGVPRIFPIVKKRRNLRTILDRMEIDRTYGRCGHSGVLMVRNFSSRIVRAREYACLSSSN